MSQLNDCKYNALRALGFTGHINDMELAWLKSVGATANQINDAWLEVAGAGQYNDQVMAYMIAQGAVGEQFNDVQLSFWCDVIMPAPIGGFSSGFSTGFDV